MTKKGTKAYRSEPIWIYYGINTNSLVVKTVWKARDGTLSGDGGYSHLPIPGKSDENELIITYDLTEIIGIAAHQLNDSGPRIRAMLEEKASAMRAERDAKAKA